MPSQVVTLFEFYSRFKLKFIKVVGLIILVLPLFSCSKNGKLSVYSCPNQFNAIGCDMGCNLEKDMQFSFVVSKEERSVLQIVFWDEKQSGSITHKNCTVFDNLNWDCSEFKQFEYVTEDSETKMANGVFTMTRNVRNISDFKLRNSDEKGTCAK
jgi:hypothetical protein